MDRSISVAIDASVLKSGRAFYLAAVTDPDILDVSGIYNGDMFSNMSDL